ncbi:hypothetical protein JW992_16605 [candidate division KSB1 bacterium]|nr:hypothetical protein [candidate division KSB1 bacterium]
MQNVQNEKQCRLLLGFDIGSEWLKIVALYKNERKASVRVFASENGCELSSDTIPGWEVLLVPAERFYGDSLSCSLEWLERWKTAFPDDSICISITGSQGKGLARLLGIDFVSDSKAIARAIVAWDPTVQTVLEIGANVSRYLRLAADSPTQVAILDYERNGECAAGTGSFLDQQAARLKLRVEEVGELVLQTDQSANIAGRCSVFAKSDMIHAQQRGYSPGAILKGLCNAVAGNFKGTVLRGKKIETPAVFIGGVAANKGLVDAFRTITGLSAEELRVPPFYHHCGAIGAAFFASTPLNRVKTLRSRLAANSKAEQPRLDDSQIYYIDQVQLLSHLSASLDKIDVYLGLDVGSVSTNLVLLDRDGRVIDSVYTRTEGRPVQVVQREFLKWHSSWGNRLTVLGVGSTGSGRDLIGELVGADVVYDEITAHKTGADFIAHQLGLPEVDTIFEIGGQDSKFISIDNGVVVDFAMNEACAAGTGSFLEEQAQKLAISIQNDFAALALTSHQPVSMGERCTVFMEKDVAAYLQQGCSKSDICAGLAFAVVQNYLNRVVRGRRIGQHIFFQGGTAYNRAVAAAFAVSLKKKIVIPPFNGVIGAVGVALLAREHHQRPHQGSRFRGFDMSTVKYTVRQIRCNGCSNQCDVQEIDVQGERTHWGDKCGTRFQRTRRRNRSNALLPDLVAFYKERLQSTAPCHSSRRIGFPRSIPYYDRYPFWQAYFAGLGFQLTPTEETNRRIISLGRDFAVAEPCFPVIAAHGHVAQLLSNDFEAVLLPNIINAETRFPEFSSWVCPWGQTLPLVIRNELPESQQNRLLTPVIRFRDGKEAIRRSLWPMARGLGVDKKTHDRALDSAYEAMKHFYREIKQTGQAALSELKRRGGQAVVLVGRPYNLYDNGMNLGLAQKLRNDYGIDVIPMDFLPTESIDIRDIHENMFWNYGRRILQVGKYIARHPFLHAIYFTNFKCGPDSYIKHFFRDAAESPYLTLQFDEHSNDAGMLTRCEAFLHSKELVQCHKRSSEYDELIVQSLETE